jgi:hypothetical protein
MNLNTILCASWSSYDVYEFYCGVYTRGMYAGQSVDVSAVSLQVRLLSVDESAEPKLRHMDVASS